MNATTSNVGGLTIHPTKAPGLFDLPGRPERLFRLENGETMLINLFQNEHRLADAALGHITGLVQVWDDIQGGRQNVGRRKTRRAGIRCIGQRRDGTRCGGRACAGSDYCGHHGGDRPALAAAARGGRTHPPGGDGP